MPSPCRLRVPRNWRGTLAALVSLHTAHAGVALAVEPQATEPQAAESLISLECRLGQGPWQPCRMRVEELGVHWFLLIGDRQVEFRHDGRGGVRLQQDGRWRVVSSRWEDTSLCWDGVCARGPIPLD